MRDKKKHTLKKAVKLKEKVGVLKNNKRILRCSRPLSKKCKKCGAISISKTDLILFQCGTKICPVCSMISSSIRSKIVTEATIKLMKKYKSIPVLIVFTLPHTKHEPLYELIHILNNAWKKLRDGGSERQRQQNKYHKKKSWWRQHFVAEIFTLEITYSQKNAWHPHLHMLAIPGHPNSRIPMGTCPWTGAILNPTNGLRSIYNECLKQAWNERHSYNMKTWKSLWQNYFNKSNKEDSPLLEKKKLIRRYPRYFVKERHLQQAIAKIENAQIYKFTELMNGELDNKTRLSLLNEVKQKEVKRITSKKHYLLHREIAALVDIKSIFYIDKKTGRRISLTWYLKNHHQILDQI